MASDISLTVGAQHIFGESGTYSPATLNDLRLGTPTYWDLDLSGTATAGILTLAAESSIKADLGANRAPEYAVHAAIEMAVVPVTGTTIDFYWAPSVSSTAGQGNPGWVNGTESVVYDGSPGTLAEGLAHLMYIGAMVMSADATGTIQMAYIATFSPPTRYGCLVVVNNTAQATHSDTVEQAVSFTPIIPQGS